MTITRTSQSEAETRLVAASLARTLQAGHCLALYGELGAGKTCFVRGLAEGLGIDPARISSPTFVLLHEYESDRGVTLAHIDAYRITGDDDAETIALDEVLASSITAIEWPDRLGDALPSQCIMIRLEHVGETARRITIEAPAGLADRLGAIEAG